MDNFWFTTYVFAWGIALGSAIQKDTRLFYGKASLAVILFTVGLLVYIGWRYLTR